MIFERSIAVSERTNGVKKSESVAWVDETASFVGRAEVRRARELKKMSERFMLMIFRTSVSWIVFCKKG